jgi:hypothetical protein
MIVPHGGLDLELYQGVRAGNDSDDESASGRRCVALSSDVRVGSGKTLRFVSTEHSWRCSP